MWAAVLFAAAALSVAAWTGRAAAADASFGVRLTYVDRSGANCPSEASLRAAAAARLGYDPFAPSGRATVEVTIARKGSGLRGEIRVDDPSRDGSASRTIDSSSGDCAELGKAMALAISIAVRTAFDHAGRTSRAPRRRAGAARRRIDRVGREGLRGSAGRGLWRDETLALVAVRPHFRRLRARRHVRGRSRGGLGRFQQLLRGRRTCGLPAIDGPRHGDD